MVSERQRRQALAHDLHSYTPAWHVGWSTSDPEKWPQDHAAGTASGGMNNRVWSVPQSLVLGSSSTRFWSVLQHNLKCLSWLETPHRILQASRDCVSYPRILPVNSLSLKSVRVHFWCFQGRTWLMRSPRGRRGGKREPPQRAHTWFQQHSNKGLHKSEVQLVNATHVSSLYHDVLVTNFSLLSTWRHLLLLLPAFQCQCPSTEHTVGAPASATTRLWKFKVPITCQTILFPGNTHYV